MFKGINKKFQEQLEKVNSESRDFIFNAIDLDIGDHGEDGNKYVNKYYICSEELRQKLWQIIQEQKQPNENIPYPKSVFFDFSKFFSIDYKSFTWWFIIPKNDIYQAAKRGVEKNKYGFLVFENEEVQETCTSVVFSGYTPDYYSSDFSSMVANEDKLEKDLRKKMLSFIDLIENEIKQFLDETNIHLNDLEINYLEILPDNCRCEVKGVNCEDDAIENSRIYRKHITSCLGLAEQKITVFKEKMLEQICLGKERFENERNAQIREIETLCAQKGVSEKSLNERTWYSENWKTRLLSGKSRKWLANEKNYLVGIIENIGDKIAQEKLREKAQQEAKRLEKEEREKRQRQAEQEAKLRQQQGAEENQRQQEEQRRRQEQQQRQEKLWKKQQELENLTLDESKTKIIQELLQSLKDNHLQTTDLSSEFHCWEEKINSLNSKQEVVLYHNAMVQAMQGIVDSRRTNPNNESGNKDNSFPQPMIVGGAFIGGIFFFGLFLKKWKKSLKKKLIKNKIFIYSF